jgi:hypothetical protein
MVCPSDFLSIFNIGQPFLSGAVVGYQYEIMGRLGKRSAKTAPMPVETPVVRTKLQKSLGGPLFQFIIGCWIPESTFLQYPGMHGERHSQTIEAKWTTSILRAAFSAK